MNTAGWRMRGLLAAGLMLLLAPAFGRTVGQVTNPRAANRGWVTDHANVIDTATEQQINERVEALQSRTSAEIAVVTVEDTSGDDTRQFATALFNTWGIGRAGADNGVLVLLNMGQRRIEIETGYGVEGVLTDRKVGQILDQAVIPRFKNGDFGGGLLAAVTAIDAALAQAGTTSPPVTSHAPSGATLNGSPPPAPAPPSPGGIGGSPILFFGFAGMMVFGGLALLIAKSKATPVCAACNKKMLHLDDDEEDEFLDPLQKLEETVGGVDYHVWQCPQCSGIVLRQQKKDSRIGTCPRCARLTLQSSQPADGVREQACQNPACNHTRTLRRLNERAEDRYLDDLQQLEESLGGMDYDVWVCDETNEVEIEGKRRMLSRIDDCPACGRRTMRHTEHLIRSATRWHDGLRRYEYRCLNPHCLRVHTRDEHIPRIVQTSSSSWSSGSSGWSSGGSSFGGGGGSSFGGGSSGGGGAGRSF